MAFVLPGFPDSPQHSMRVELGNSTYQLTFTWRERTQGWYLDIHDEDDAPIRLGRRLSPGWGPLLGVNVAELRDVLLLTLGEEPYTQADLGEGLRVLVLEGVRDRSPNADELTVTVEVS